MGGMKSIPLFRPGTHTAMSGAALAFSDADVAGIAAAYDPALHEAPLVIGHPTTDTPARGWVKSLSFADGVLAAAPDQVDAAFAEWVAAGRYKKISASLYPPAHPANPKPGAYYLKHVGFLGGAAPAVKGLPPIQFADDPECVTLDFSVDGFSMARFFTGLREWLIDKFDLDTADRVAPSWLADEARTESLPQPAQQAFNENEDDPMTEAEKARLTELETRNAELESEAARLKTEAAAFAEREAAAVRAAATAEHTAFADGLVKDGRLLPADRPLAVALLDAAAAAPVEFGEGAQKATLDAARLKTFLAALPVQVAFGEAAAPEAGAVRAVAAPAGFSVDPESLDLHTRALAYADAHKTDYVAAVIAVSKGAPQ